MFKIFLSTYLIAIILLIIGAAQSVLLGYAIPNPQGQGSTCRPTPQKSQKCSSNSNRNVNNGCKNNNGCNSETNMVFSGKVNVQKDNRTNSTAFSPGDQDDSTATFNDNDSLFEWKSLSSKHHSQNQGIDELGIHDELAKNQYRVHNEYTPHFDTYLKRQYDSDINKIINWKNELILEEKTKQEHKHISISKIDEYKGATKLFSKLNENQPTDFKIGVQPEIVDFGDVKICTQSTKELVITNLNLRGNVGKNVEIANITTESPLIKVDHSESYPIMVRPGKDITLKVMALPHLTEPFKTVITIQTRNFYKFVVLVKFNGINNEYNIQPILAEKPFKVPPVINFSLKNYDAKDELNLKLSSAVVVHQSTDVEIYQIAKKSGSDEDQQCNNILADTRCFKPIEKTIDDIVINPEKIKTLFYMKFDNKNNYNEFIVSFKLKNQDTNKLTTFVVPVYIMMTRNHVEFFSTKLDLGILYANSQMTYKMPIRVKSVSKNPVKVGVPYVPSKSALDFDFSKLVSNRGVVDLKDSSVIGYIILTTQGLNEGEHSGIIVFCEQKLCTDNSGRSSIQYTFIIAKDPLNVKSKMHSFEIDHRSNKYAGNGSDKNIPITPIQLLWLKNTFSESVQIEDITCHDKEMNVSVMVSKDYEDVKSEQQCCFSSMSLMSSQCTKCRGIFSTNSGKSRLLLKPNEENEDVKIRYEYSPKKSKTIEIKYITVWTNTSYVPVPVFIYDKTLACSFESFNMKESDDYPFGFITSSCHTLPAYEEMNFGPVAEYYNHRRVFRLVNLNPLPIFIQRIRVLAVTCGDEEVLDVDRSELGHNYVKLVPETTIDIFSGKQKRNFSNENKEFSKLFDPSEEVDNDMRAIQSSDFTIPSNSIINFRVELISPILNDNERCVKHESGLVFSSLQAPDFRIPISYEVVKGGITLFPSDMVRFPPSIPGVVHSKNIIAKSSINKKIYIESVTSSNPNKVTVKLKSNTLEPNVKKEIIEVSTVAYDHMNSFLHNSEILDYFKYGSGNDQSQSNLDSYSDQPALTYFDILAWQVEQKQWDDRQSPRSTDTSSIITINTNLIQNITIPASTVVTKPSLLSQDVYEFDKIEVGTETRGTITIHNPSPDPLEVSFFIAPENFMELIISRLLDESSTPKWKILCDKATFLDPYGRSMCTDLLEIDELSESRKQVVLDYFIRNYFNFIMMADTQDPKIKEFISEQQALMIESVESVSNVTNMQKPQLKKEIKQDDDIISVFHSFFDRLHHKVHSYFEDHTNDETLEENEKLIEGIRVRIHNFLDGAIPQIKEEFQSMLDIFKRHFFIEHNAKCKRDQYGEGEDDDCHSECNGRRFIIPGKSSIDYSCFLFHPVIASNYTEGYLLIKNNLTHVFPLKLVGTSGRAQIIVEAGPVESQAGILRESTLSKDNDDGIDLFFDLNMKHGLFNVKAFEGMNNTELSRQLRKSLRSNEKLTPNDLSLITEHKIKFNLTNIGSIDDEVRSVSISNHGHSFNGFTVKNTSEGYEMIYTPNFKNSRVTEELVVTTKYNRFEFTMQAYIPMYLIRYIDGNFRVSEIEQSIGNYYYLILLMFMLLVFGLLGSEILSYISYMKQKGLRYEILQNFYKEHKTEYNAKVEDKVVYLENFIQNNNIKKAKEINEEIFDAYACATICYDTNCAAHEVKKLLSIDLGCEEDSRSSSASSNRHKADLSKKQTPTKQKFKNQGRVGSKQEVQQKSLTEQHFEQKLKPIKNKPNKKRPKDAQIDKNVDPVVSKESKPISKPKVESSTVKVDKSKSKIIKSEPEVPVKQPKPGSKKKQDVGKPANKQISAAQKVDVQSKKQNKGKNSDKKSTKTYDNSVKESTKKDKVKEDKPSKPKAAVKEQKPIPKTKAEPKVEVKAETKPIVKSSKPKKEPKQEEKPKVTKPKKVVIDMEEVSVPKEEPKKLKQTASKPELSASLDDNPLIVKPSDAAKQIKDKENSSVKETSNKESPKESIKSEPKKEKELKHSKSNDSWGENDDADVSMNIEDENKDDKSTKNRPSDVSKQSKTSDKQSASQHSQDEGGDQIPHHKQRAYHGFTSDEYENEYGRDLKYGRQYAGKGRDFDNEARQNKLSSYQDYKKHRKIDSRRTGGRGGGYGQYHNYPYRNRRNQYYGGKQYDNPNFNRRNYNRNYYAYPGGNKEYQYNKDNYLEQDEYYENEFYKTNYRNKQGYYDKAKYDTYAESYYATHKDDKDQKEGAKARSKDAYDKFIEEQFSEDAQDQNQQQDERNEEAYYDAHDKFYNDEEDKMDDDQDEEPDQPDDQRKTFFNDEDFQSTPCSMFSAFDTPQDFALFAPADEGMFDQQHQNPLKFDFMQDQDKGDNKDAGDDLFYRFDNLDELRKESEKFSYDLDAQKEPSSRKSSTKKI